MTGAQQGASGGYASIASGGPMIMPWPYSHDSNGIEYPAGLVAMVTGLPNFGTWNGDWTAYAIANSPTMIAIPASLPTGYTRHDPHCLNKTGMFGVMRVKNLARFYRCGQRVDYNYGFPTYVLSAGGCNVFPPPNSGVRTKNFPRVWTKAPGDDRLRDHLWGPMLHNGYGVPPFGSYAGGGTGFTFPAFSGAVPESVITQGWVAVHQGWRYLKARYTSLGTLAQMRIKVTRQSDWTNPGGFAPGPTTIHDVTVGPFTDVAAWSDLDIGAVLPPLGTFGWVNIQILATPDPVLAAAVQVGTISGNRCDIPIVATVAYRDWQGTDHVVPGGYVASLLANPPYFPGQLFGSFNYYAAESAGDGKYVYLKYVGLPSTNYTLYSNGFSVGGIQFFPGDEATGEPLSGIGPPGLGPWTFTTGADGVAWVIIDIHGENGTAAQFRVS